jgi:hypothetical protein
MTFDQWVAEYQPIKNPIDPNSSYDGCLFETYGPEWDFVRQQPLLKIWTLIETDEQMVICSGIHFVDRLGYFVTLNPFALQFFADEAIEIDIDTHIDA